MVSGGRHSGGMFNGEVTRERDEEELPKSRS